MLSPHTSNINNTPSFSGSMVALLTPMTLQGDLDFAAFAHLIEYQLAGGTRGLVPCGTTGESATLSLDEHLAVMKHCVDTAKGRCPVIAGTGSNNTTEAIELTQAAAAMGADAALLITPYYNKPTKAGLLAHFQAIHDATSLPLFLYDVPSRTGLALPDDVILSLANLPRMAGIKDATGDMGRILRLRARGLRENFVFLSGDDASALAFYAVGAVGSISVTANVAPKGCADVYTLAMQGQWDQARAIQQTLMPLHDALFYETSPGPVKYAASRLGLCDNVLRLPLVPVTDATEKALNQAMIGLS
jgi:4-hydroxy-tetrahydrodipicolinate synthase